MAMSDRASQDELRTVEQTLGVDLPEELRALLSAHNGWERWYGDTYVMVYGTNALVAVNQELERLPGFLAFGSDGSRELIGFDLRRHPSPVVMVDITAAGWGDALFQAESLAEFMDQRSRAEDLRWDQPYVPS